MNISCHFVSNLKKEDEKQEMLSVSKDDFCSALIVRKKARQKAHDDVRVEGRRRLMTIKMPSPNGEKGKLFP
jgi:hypothetical protein